MTVIHMTAGKEEQNTETTNLPTVIMDSSGGDESDPRFVKISSIICFPERFTSLVAVWLFVVHSISIWNFQATKNVRSRGTALLKS